MIKSLLVATQFLTRIPVPLRSVTEGDLGRSIAFFPVVGLLVGGVLAGSYSLFVPAFPDPLARVLVLFVWIMVSGAFHLDGLSDTVDGLYAGRTREEVLRIMKDPHVGAMGVIAIGCSLLIKASALVSLEATWVRGALLFLPVLGHAAMVLTLAAGRNLREAGLCSPFRSHAGHVTWAFALAMGAASVGRWAGLMSAGASLIGIGLFLAYIRARVGGITGDICGASNEIAEAAALVSFVGLVRLPLEWPFWGWTL